MVLKSKEELILMRESARLVSKTLGMLASEIKPGAHPLKLDQMAEGEYFSNLDCLILIIYP